jgi:hypothetical protein
MLTSAGSRTTNCAYATGAGHGGLGEALAGLLDPGGAGGLKSCRRGTGDVHGVVVEEQHPPGWHLQQVCDVREGCDVGLEQARLEGQEPVVEQARQRPSGDVIMPATTLAANSACGQPPVTKRRTQRHVSQRRHGAGSASWSTASLRPDALRPRQAPVNQRGRAQALC